MAKASFYLLLDHLKIHGANAISSPLTYGFPSVTGFLGAVHALSRSIAFEDELYLDGVLVACHQCDVQVYRQHDFADYTFKLTRNPLDKGGKPQSIIEEGKVHLDVSLVIEVIYEGRKFHEEQERQKFEQQIKQQIMQQRVAGGSVLSIDSVKLYDAYSDDLIKEITYQLLPAFVLMQAQEEWQSITEELQQHDPCATMLDALIETAKLHHIPPNDENKEWQTQSAKTGRGWLVPIHLGYQAISPLFKAGEVKDTRDTRYDAQFVECIYGLGKWVFSFHLKEEFKQAFWRYQPPTEQDNGSELYLITQQTDY